MSFKFYGDVADHYGITVAKVAAIVKKHELTKRRIYGLMAVDATAMRETMQRLGYVDRRNLVVEVSHEHKTAAELLRRLEDTP